MPSLNDYSKEHIQFIMDNGIIDAMHQHKTNGDLYNTSTGFKELKENLTRLVNALDKIERGTADIIGNIGRVKQKIRKIPKSHLFYLDALDRDFSRTVVYDPKISAFERIAFSLDKLSADQRIIQAGYLKRIAQMLIDDLLPPGKGGAKKNTLEYAMAIRCLAWHYKEAYPDRPFTYNKKTRFYNYVLDFMVKVGHIESEDREDTDITRHIKAALEKLEKLTL